jgi:hypothetical protein
MRITLTCQVANCGREFHDVDEYYVHQVSHEEEKKVKEK